MVILVQREQGCMAGMDPVIPEPTASRGHLPRIAPTFLIQVKWGCSGSQPPAHGPLPGWQLQEHYGAAPTSPGCLAAWLEQKASGNSTEEKSHPCAGSQKH